MRKLLLIVVASMASTLACTTWALESSGYMPADAQLDENIPSPESVLGWQVGDWRVSHDRLVHYMQALAAASDRVNIKQIGSTYEQRPLLQLTITSPQNHSNIETLREQHLRAAHGEAQADTPLVVLMGHSVHGNEASGSNASLLLAYYLAASQSEFVTELLNNSIILLDPSFNPDGLNRFASWANANRSLHAVADPNGRVHNPNWPSARTNHYLFDLNRDWLPLVHPESRARLREFHRWLPHLLTDQHERGGDGYFFQPGVPSRQNPLTTPENLAMTRALAQHHAQAMDAAGEIYFTEDVYDDYYYGKGSTYPDINGSIGILFEQPSIYGPEMNRDTGLLTFVNAIQNQLRTSISTLRGASALRDELKAHQRGFFNTMRERASNAGHQAWVVGDDGDPGRVAEFLALMAQHQIEFKPLNERLRQNGHTFEPGRAWVLPVKQRQFGLLQAMMETRTEFEDETFYDVSAWTLPLAYNLPFARLTRLPKTRTDNQPNAMTIRRQAAAWIVPWGQLKAPALLRDLLKTGAIVRTATRGFSAETANGAKRFAEGSLLIHAGLQTEAVADDVYSILSLADASGVQVFDTLSAFTADGPDLGAPHFQRVHKIRPLLLTGPGVSEYDAGEAWFTLDRRLGMAPVMVRQSQLPEVSLSAYTHLLMVSGNYDGINPVQKQRISQWVSEGGILVAMASASRWAETLCFQPQPDDCAASEDQTPDEPPADRAYGSFDDDAAQQVIGGAIFATTIDRSHPLAYGFQRDELPLFRRGTTLLTSSNSAYATPVRYTAEPLMAGFIGPDQLDKIRNQPAVIAERQGQGLVIRMANNPLFRGFWRGTERLFVNALYMGQVVRHTRMPN